MSEQEILEKAIAKAVEGGWEPINGKPVTVQQWQDKGMVEIGVLYPDKDEPVSWVRELEGIIFNHEFAKSLWGYGKGVKQYDVTPEINAWQHHLQMLVIDPNPIEYLGENI